MGCIISFVSCIRILELHSMCSLPIYLSQLISCSSPSFVYGETLNFELVSKLFHPTPVEDEKRVPSLESAISVCRRIMWAMANHWTWTLLEKLKWVTEESKIISYKKNNFLSLNLLTNSLFFSNGHSFGSATCMPTSAWARAISFASTIFCMCSFGRSSRVAQS